MSDAAQPVDPNRIRTVLVVDDDPDMREFIRFCLEPLHWRILESPDGRQALLAAGAEPGLDLVITDIRMPGMTGVEMADRLPVAPSGTPTPVLFVTGEDTAVPQGPVMRKPFTGRKLRAWCLALLDSE